MTNTSFNESALPKLSGLQITTILVFVFGVRAQLLLIHGSSTPYWDDWGVGSFLYSYLSNGLAETSFFNAGNEHLYIFAKLLNILLIDLNDGQWDPMVVNTANIFLNTGVAAVILLIANHSRSEINPWFVAAVVLVLWAFPVSLHSIIWAMQAHTYFMILLVVMGCWCATSKPLSKTWFIGMAALLAAPLSLAGGVLAAVAVAGFYFIRALFDKTLKRDHLITSASGAFIAIAGLAVVLMNRKDTTSALASNSIENAFSTMTKTLSWPHIDQFWPAFLLILPGIVLFTVLCRSDGLRTRFNSFSLLLFAYTLLLSVVIAYTRGVEGAGPPRRYFEFLSLSILAGACCLGLLQHQKFKPHVQFNRLLIFTWLVAFLSGMPALWYSYSFTVDEEQILKPAQTLHVRNYIVTKDRKHLVNKPFRHVPFHSSTALGDFIDTVSSIDMLPYNLQVPKKPTFNKVSSDAFVVNGTFAPSLNPPILDYNAEPAMGSYNRRKGGMLNVGTYVSEPIETSRPYLMIPITGYLGFPGLRLQIKDLDSGRVTKIKPQSLGSKYAEGWRSIWIKSPKGKFQIEAIDESESLWFGFARPRQVGLLSYKSIKLLEKADDMIRMSLLLFLLTLVPAIQRTLANRAVS